MEAAARPSLQLVSDSDEETFRWPETGELLSPSDATHKVRDLLDRLDGYKRTVDRQARDLGTLSRRIEEEENPASHPLGAEIVALIERWMRGTRHPKSKVSADRVKLVKARIKDGYPISSEEELPSEATLELAVDGVAALPYVANGQRKPTGSDSQRHDRLGIPLGGGEKVEEFARYGYMARKAGWTIEDGWPA